MLVLQPVAHESRLAIAGRSRDQGPRAGSGRGKACEEASTGDDLRAHRWNKELGLQQGFGNRFVCSAIPILLPRAFVRRPICSTVGVQSAHLSHTLVRQVNGEAVTAGLLLIVGHYTTNEGEKENCCL